MVVGVPHRLTAPGCAQGTPELREVVLDVLGGRDLPVLGQVDIGHAGPNLLLPLGVRAEDDATARTLTLLEAAVTVRPSGTLRTGNRSTPPRDHGTESVPHRAPPRARHAVLDQRLGHELRPARERDAGEADPQGTDNGEDDVGDGHGGYHSRTGERNPC